MTNPVWPAALCPGGMELRLHKSGSQHKSPFTGSLQACDYIGERWEVNIQLHGEGRTRANSGLLEALLMRLSGGVNQIDVYHWRRPQPIGALRGSPTLQVASVRGGTQLVLNVAAGSTLEAGDLLGLSLQLFMVRTRCQAVGTTLTVPLVNRVANASAIGTAAVWDKPLLACVMPEMSAGLSYQPGQTLPAEIMLTQARVLVEVVVPPAPSEAMLDFSVAANSMYVPVLAL